MVRRFITIMVRAFITIMVRAFITIMASKRVTSGAYDMTNLFEVCVRQPFQQYFFRRHHVIGTLG